MSTGGGGTADSGNLQQYHMTMVLMIRNLVLQTPMFTRDAGKII